MRDDWVSYVDGMPPSWTDDNFLSTHEPICVLTRYGQNQPIVVQQHLAHERKDWQEDRDYSEVRSLSFAIATDFT